MEKAVLVGDLGFYLVTLLLFATISSFLLRFRLVRAYRERLVKRITKFVVTVFFVLLVFSPISSFAFSSTGDEAKCVLWGITNGKSFETDYVNDLIDRLRGSGDPNSGYYLDILKKYLEFGKPRILIDPFGSIGDWPPEKCR